ncbi:hypothetical protein [Candidatus Solincola tengchongensis]|uniref:hypothetical protein n=1 Tax=Candidatus Solincola tengchongensis TaxID=2900693 RepID=UPI002580A3AC|nr:hypothetical protein [Candidatus Solincola tengchongensis]
MGLTFSAERKLEEIRERHGKEFGKVVQKLLALTFTELGYRLAEERAVQGVDIDVLCEKSGRKMSFEVKTCQGERVSIAEKDVEGLRTRHEVDGYEPYFAFLFRPHYIAEGWIIVPGDRIKRGEYSSLRLASWDVGALSERINEEFSRTVERTYKDLISCAPGGAQALLKRKYGI